MICPRCTKNTNGGYAHTCTPTDEWRKLEAENAALKAEVERLRTGFDRFLGSCEECTDQDGWLAFMCSADDFHEAQSVLEEGRAMKPEFFCAEDERDWLRQQLPASQAREQQLREALEKLSLYVAYNGDDWVRIAARDALGYVTSDTAAIESVVKKACEVMRDRAAVEASYWQYTDMTPYEIAKKIRALPDVMLDDLNLS